MPRLQAQTSRLQIEIKKKGKRDHAADATAVGAQTTAIARIVKSLLTAYEEDRTFLVNARPLRRGSLIIPLEIIVFEPPSLLGRSPVFDEIERLLGQFLNVKLQIGDGPFHIDAGNKIITSDKEIIVDALVYEMLRPGRQESRLMGEAFAMTADDKSITAVHYTSNSGQEPIAVVSRDDFESFRTPYPEQVLSATRVVSTRETLVVRSVAFDSSLSWHFVWQGRPITASLTSERFLTDVRESKEAFRNGDQLVVQLSREQVYDSTARTHIDKRFTVIDVIDHIQVKETGNLFE